MLLHIAIVCRSPYRHVWLCSARCKMAVQGAHLYRMIYRLNVNFRSKLVHSTSSLAISGQVEEKTNQLHTRARRPVPLLVEQPVRERARPYSATAMSSSTDEKFPVLDGLRAISILLVLADHLLPIGPKVWQLNATAGSMGMSLFFALSGFLITSGLIKNPNISEFMARRLARILPLSFVYTIIVFLIFSLDPKALLWTNLFFVNYLSQYLNGWNAHFWSLCVEMQFYFAIALIVLIGGRRGLWVVWPACLAITLLRVYGEAYIDIRTHLRVDEILSGACVATLYNSGARLRSVKMVMLAAASLWAITGFPLVGPLQHLRPYATGLLLLASLQHGAANPDTLLASRPMRYLARISYALYIIHPATAHGWMSEGSLMAKYLFKRPISFALTFILAHLSTFYWENRWQFACKQWMQRRRVAGGTIVCAAAAKDGFDVSRTTATVGALAEQCKGAAAKQNAGSDETRRQESLPAASVPLITLRRSNSASLASQNLANRGEY